MAPEVFFAGFDKKGKMNPALDIEATVMCRSRAFHFLWLPAVSINLLLQAKSTIQKGFAQNLFITEKKSDGGNLEVVIGAVIIYR